MSKPHSAARRTNRLPEILIFAEDPHDSTALKCLADALNPSLSGRCQLVVLRDPVSLTRNALPPTVKSWMSRIADVVKLRSMAAEVTAILVHQDADAPDRDNEPSLRSALSAAVTIPGHPIVPVQEMEAWWFLYPEALRNVKPRAWRNVKLPSGQNVEAVRNPKEELIRRTRQASAKNAYSEADSLAVATEMARMIRAGDAASNTAPAWDAFGDLVRSL